MTTQAGLLTNEGARMQGILLMCCAIATFSLLDSAAKYLVTVSAVPIFQAIWFRFVSHVGFTLAVFGPRNFAHSMKSAKPGLQILRGIFLFATTGFNYAALQYLQLDQVATIFFLSPFVVAVLAGPILGEWVGMRRLIAIMVGFSGVILVMRPGYGGIHWAVSYSFCATISYAAYNILTRYLASHDSSLVTQVYSPLAGVVMLAPLAFWTWQWPAELFTWGLMISTGISGGFGHYLLILAHRRCPAPILAPFSYLGLITQSLVGYAVFSQLPSGWTLAGGAVIISSGLYLLYRERRMLKTEGPAAATLSSDLPV
ncbi:MULTISPECIES: DMT family transporter [Rhodomicrobium]|uniref:DMT family transporter n=1 Tax=Rhodomicrobium TaxID=1068 RepID=UPI000B4BD3F0|nr:MULTISPECIES: DMT family transporter [Rhodomicrobium]